MKHQKIKNRKGEKVMMYQSKKDESVMAKVVETDEKYKTSILEYTTGEKVGQTINVTEATLKRWWKKVEETEVKETEVLHVDVVDDESGETVSMDINPDEFVPGVDDVDVKYDFNNQEKKYIPMPQAVCELYKLGDDIYPSVEEVVDMMVEWGASIKAYKEWIKMLDGTRIIFRRNKRCINKSLIEVRMKEEIKIPEYETKHVPLKGALLKATPYVIYAKTIKDLEKVVKSLVTTQ